MNPSTVRIPYAQSLLWIAFFAAFILCVSLDTHLVFFDLIHRNPHRTLSDVIAMMTMQSALIGVLAAIGALLVFTVPQVFQAALVDVAHRAFGNRSRFSVLAALPITAILTWYWWDYLTPSDLGLGITAPPDWTPYQHGISTSRYLGALAFQAPATLLSFLYLDAKVRGRSVRPVLYGAIAIAFGISIYWGHVMTQDQIRFQERETSRSLN